MQENEMHLPFECYNCGFRNNYPAIKDEKVKGGDILVKRCMSCATYNQITLPTQFRAKPATVQRGMKHDE